MDLLDLKKELVSRFSIDFPKIKFKLSSDLKQIIFDPYNFGKSHFWYSVSFNNNYDYKKLKRTIERTIEDKNEYIVNCAICFYGYVEAYTCNSCSNDICISCVKEMVLLSHGVYRCPHCRNKCFTLKNIDYYVYDQIHDQNSKITDDLKKIMSGLKYDYDAECYFYYGKFYKPEIAGYRSVECKRTWKNLFNFIFKLGLIAGCDLVLVE